MDKGYLDGPKDDSFKKRLFDDVYVNEVLDLLEGSGMQEEKEQARVSERFLPNFDEKVCFCSKITAKGI